jgi:hypothetical protein
VIHSSVSPVRVEEAGRATRARRDVWPASRLVTRLFRVSTIELAKGADMGLRLFLGTVLLLAGIVASDGLSPAQAITGPIPVVAYYMNATTPSGLESQAYSDGYNFAQGNCCTRVLILDFGAARCLSGCGTHNACPNSGAYGAKDFSLPTNTTFSNGDILDALESAADGAHAGYTNGMNIIAYGNNNSDFSGMTYEDICSAGYYQEQRAQSLESYIMGQGYGEGVAAGSDMQMPYSGPVQAEQLVNGAAAQGFTLYYDYGSADGCPTSGSGNCSNGWSQHDVGYVSFNANAVPLPEIYEPRTTTAAQWATIGQKWGNGYYFAGATGQPPSDYAQDAWVDLYNDYSPGTVDRQLSCFGC